MARSVTRFASVVILVAVTAAFSPIGASGRPTSTSTAEAPAVVPIVHHGSVESVAGRHVSPGFVGTATGATALELSAPGGATPIGERSVIGDDGRRRVTDTEEYPARAIGQIELMQNDVPFICTGWLIDTNTILSSGHCGYDDSNIDDPIETATFSPGRDRATSMTVDPFGTCNVTDVYAPSQWRLDHDPKHDWSLMHLDCTIGESVGWFGYFWRGPIHALEGIRGRVAGYPGDKPFGTQWGINGKIRVSKKLTAFYKMDTFGGQSGSPVFQTNRPACGDGPCSMAVHSYGGPLNSGPRITKNRFELIQDLADDNDPT